MTSPCACGACDRQADRGSRYHGDHFARLVAARRKLKRLQRYAEPRGIYIDVDLIDILDLVHRRWPDTSWQLRRANRDEGFTGENIIVCDRRTRTPGGARLLLDRVIGALRRRHPDRDFREALEAFSRQSGRCAVSGRKLQIIGRPTDADALDVRPQVDEAGMALVIRAVAEHEARWGRRHLVDLAGAIARATNESPTAPATKRPRER
ncbi:MAG: hypothetical protein M9894_20680 [Planctomycetes bacterium]|nr:hypothetical protein [Planctomycetota bacterium]